MPPLSRLLIRTGLIHLVLALSLGTVHAAAVAGVAPPIFLGLYATQLHFLTLGFLTHLIAGVAHWMFPVHRIGSPRGREAWLGFGYAALNVGLGLRLLAEPFPSLLSSAVRGPLLIASAACLLVFGAIFALGAARRVR